MHQYDDSIDPVAHTNFEFKRCRIDGSDCHERGIYSLETILKRDLEGSSNAIVKLDIESSEWAALENCTSQVLKDHVIALYIEFHDISQLLDNAFYHRALNVLTQLRDDYVPVFFHPNNCGCLSIFGNRAFPDVFELSLVRKDMIEAPSNGNTPQAVASPNTQYTPDIHTGSLLK